MKELKKQACIVTRDGSVAMAVENRGIGHSTLQVCSRVVLEWIDLRMIHSSRGSRVKDKILLHVPL
jgi:sulfopyruvate decarboxylase TPP-binding subunit